MRAFDKVRIAITRGPVNGHALANMQNNKSLAAAKSDIEEMLKKANHGTA